VNARVTEAEREIDAFNEVVVSSGDGLSRELREQLARAEETRVALENELARVTANAIAQEGELKKLRVMVEHDAPGVRNFAREWTRWTFASETWSRHCDTRKPKKMKPFAKCIARARPLQKLKLTHRVSPRNLRTVKLWRR